MKYLRHLCYLTVIVLIAHTSPVLADGYDSDTATIKKSTDSTAKVTIGSKSYMTPISFDDGASWDNVKDHYEVSEAAESLIKENKAAISIGSDGTASFKPCASGCKKKK